MRGSEYNQLRLSLPSTLGKDNSNQSKNSRSSLRRSQSNEMLFDLFEITRPIRRKKIARGRGLKFDNELTEKCRRMAGMVGLNELADQVKVFWNLRLSSTAGLAHHSNAQIDLNPRLERFAPTEPERTLLHELAHLIAHFRASGRRIKPHGPEWQSACLELGIPGEKRCHDLPLANRVIKRKLAYQCRCCGIIVPRVRKLSRDSACYPCCQKYNRGGYSRRFLLEKISIKEAKLLAPEHNWA
ncbi:MAG: SprT-like domain-containing protein [Verrucomicrobiota bacterium]|nr:SprT-like domain-containing protein [Verrucomicrobiota bacterium]